MYTTDAIILSSRPSGEADETVSCFAREYGKLTVRARGTKKTTTKQGNFLHSFGTVRMSFVLAKGGPLLSGVKDTRTYRSIANDIFAAGYVASFLSLCDAVLYDGQPDEALWALLTGVLTEADEISTGNAQDKNALLWHKEKMWLFSLLDVLGMRPEKTHAGHIASRRGLDAHVQGLLQRKLERPISFFGLHVSAQQ